VGRPNISSFYPEALSYITIKGSQDPFDVLPSAQHWAGAEPAAQLQSDLTDKEISEYLANDPYPLPRTDDREGYHEDRHFLWWLSGLTDFFLVSRELQILGKPLTGQDRVFELGCASGRVLRHFACQTSCEVWGADINLRHVEWMRLFLPEHIKIMHTTVLPQLPLESNYFDVVMAFSVFTHIDDFEFGWLAEIRRILRPGGIAYLTAHTDDTWNKQKHDWIKRTLMSLRDHIPDYKIDEAFFSGRLPYSKTVFWWSLARTYNASVFVSREHIYREWGRFFDVLRIVPRGHVYQDVVILKKS
jgi:SAM-dependent methyltransferase